MTVTRAYTLRFQRLQNHSNFLCQLMSGLVAQYAPTIGGLPVTSSPRCLANADLGLPVAIELIFAL